MGVGAVHDMYSAAEKSLRSLSHLLMSFCYHSVFRPKEEGWYRLLIHNPRSV